MPAKGYVIAQVIAIHDQDGFARYRELVGPTVTKYDGRFIVRGGAAERIEGTAPCGRVVVIEFASVAQAKSWYHSAEYQAVLALRLPVSTVEVMIVEGV